MRKHSRQEEEDQAEKPTVKSKYFSIDSYFKSPPNKKPKTTTFEQQVERAIELSLQRQQEHPSLLIEREIKKEQCLLCQKYIFIESESMEVHVNACLDSQQQQLKENVPPPVPVKNTTTIWKEKFTFAASINDENKKEEEKEVENKKSVSPSSWKSMFSSSNNNTAISVPLEMKNVNTSSITPPKLNNRTCPFYKRVRDTRFTVDAFNYGKISDCDGYFLTHYHSDHYGGLRSNWKNGPIYCTKVTANLVKQELRVDSRYIHPLPLNEIYPIPNSNVEIVLIDANHCPGSVLILFIIKDKGRRHLHTGDFRAQPKMCLNQFICQPKNPPINCLYLDTTYLNPQYSFPAQEECIQAVCDIVLKELDVGSKSSSLLDNWMIKLKKDDLMLTNTPQDKVLIVVGTYTIGKERVFINIAKMLKCKIFAPTKKNKILLCQEDDELKAMITNNPLEAQIHVVSLRDIKSDLMVNYLSQYKSHFTSLIAFKPTGWTYKSTITETKDMKLAPLSHVIIPPIDRSLKLTPYYDKHCVKLFGVPYSEHSSFRELASFIASLDIKQIIPTVNMNRLNEMNQYFDKWNQDKSSKRIEVVTYPNEDHW